MRLDPYPKFVGTPDQVARKLSDQFREHALQVNLLSEGYAAAAHTARTAMPDSGGYKQGDFVRKSDYTVAGAASSQYVVIGWLRLTDGEAHVLNTDWAEARVLTGT